MGELFEMTRHYQAAKNPNSEDAVLSIEETTKIDNEREVPSVACPIFSIFCCIPLGVASLLFQQKAKRAFESGDREEFEKSSKKTKTFYLAGIILGSILLIVEILQIIIDDDDDDCLLLSQIITYYLLP